MRVHGTAVLQVYAGRGGWGSGTVGKDRMSARISNCLRAMILHAPHYLQCLPKAKM